MIKYEPASGALKATGIQAATINAVVKVLLDSPLIECTHLLRTAKLDVTDGGTIKGNVTHTDGELSSNGKALHLHKHPGDSGGQTPAPI